MNHYRTSEWPTTNFSVFELEAGIVTLIVDNDGHQYHVPEAAPHIGVYTSSWGLVLELAHDRGAKRVAVRDNRTGKIVAEQDL